MGGGHTSLWLRMRTKSLWNNSALLLLVLVGAGELADVLDGVVLVERRVVVVRVVVVLVGLGVRRLGRRR